MYILNLYNRIKVGKLEFLTFIIIKNLGGVYIKVKKIIFIIIITIIIFSKNSFGKYFTRFQLESNNEITEPVISIENDETININSINNKTYNFKIKNYNNEGKVSELNIEYYINISSIKDVSLKVYNNNDEIKLNNGNTDKYSLDKNTKQEDVYKIEIVFLDDSDKEIFEEINMKIYFEQKN